MQYINEICNEMLRSKAFMLNGYETLGQFREVEEQDLDCLGILDVDTRTRLLTAVANLIEYETSSSPWWVNLLEPH